MASANLVDGSKIKQFEHFVKSFDTVAAGRVILLTRTDSQTGSTFYLTDGVDVWKSAVKSEADRDEFCSKLSAAPATCEVVISQEECLLSVKHSSRPVDLPLSKITSNDERTSELKQIIFYLVTTTSTLEGRLRVVQDKVESLQQKSPGKNIFDIGFDSKKKKTKQKAAPKQVGMSVVNPGSKKRAAPKGVEFDA